MTKDELYALLYLPSEGYVSETEKYLDEFFESNVVIPKGENRHELADIIHAFAEGAIVECKTKGFFQEYKWATYSAFNFDLKDKETEVRIKPSEPVYEYLYAVVTSVSGSARLEWLTPIESVAKYGNNAYVIEQTKRERK